jgi:hypothetical protein
MKGELPTIAPVSGSRLFGPADADHDDEDHAHRAEIHKVSHHRSQHEADAMAAQQAVDGGCRMLNLVCLRVHHLIIDRCSRQVKQVREDNHQPGKNKENHRRSGTLFPTVSTPSSSFCRNVSDGAAATIEIVRLCSLMTSVPSMLAHR